MLIKKIKLKSKKNIWLVGGGKLTASFLNKNLIDELIIYTMPIVLTAGVPLFKGVNKEKKLKLINSKCYSSGVIEAKYKIK